MISQGSGNKTDQPIFSRLWGSGFLPSEHQGVRFRSGGDPVLYLSNPPGVDAASRRAMLDGVEPIERTGRQSSSATPRSTRGSPSTKWPSACRRRCPSLTDLSDEPQRIIDMYGIDDSGVDGGYARNCLLARRMAERGVRFIQLMHRGWDQHGSLPAQIRGQCKDVDQPTAALVKDLKATRPAGRHAGRFGAASSAARCTARAPDQGQLRPRPSRPLLHHVGWRAAASSRGSRTAKPTTTATTSSRTRSTSTTGTPRSCAAWGSITSG